MDPQYRRYLIFTFAGVVGIFLLILAGYGVRDIIRGPFYVVSTQPKNKTTLDIVSPVAITYNIPVATSTTKNFSISPKVSGTLSTKGDILTFTPQDNLKLHQKYTVVVSKSYSANGKYSIGSYTLSFTAGYVFFNQLPKSQQKASIQATDSIYKEFPVTRYLPYENVHYYIDFTGVTNGKLDVSIQLYALYINNNVAMYQQDLLQFQQEAEQWLTTYGGNIANMNIIWSPDPSNPATYSNLSTMPAPNP